MFPTIPAHVQANAFLNLVTLEEQAGMGQAPRFFGIRHPVRLALLMVLDHSYLELIGPALQGPHGPTPFRALRGRCPRGLPADVTGPRPFANTARGPMRTPDLLAEENTSGVGQTAQTGRNASKQVGRVERPPSRRKRKRWASLGVNGHGKAVLLGQHLKKGSRGGLHGFT